MFGIYVRIACTTAYTNFSIDKYLASFCVLQSTRVIMDRDFLLFTLTYQNCAY